MIRRACEWVAGTSFEDIPPEVRALGKVQLMDSIAAICAGARSDVGCKVLSAMGRTASPGPCTLLPGGASWAWSDTVYTHAALINALEMDNFSLMGHFSQSAVSVSLAIGELTGATFQEVLRAQILAVELSGRMGAYMATGPQQGHMRAFVHRCGGAIAAGCLLGLSARQLSAAVSIALSMPEFPLYPASFSPETKVTATSAPAVEGCRAAFLAAEGLTAAEDILEHPVGFWEYFSYMDYVPDLWGNLGNTWSTLALSIKDQASCAYSQAAVVAAARLRQDPAFDLQAIQGIVVETSLLSVLMESFSQPHRGADITPVNTQFSTRRNVAAALLHGPLNGDFYAAGHFEGRKTAILALSERVELKHDWEMTIRLSQGFDAGLSGGGKPGLLGTGHASKTLSVMKKAFGTRRLLGPGDLLPLFNSVKRRDRNYFFRRYYKGLRPKFPFWSANARQAYRSQESQLEKIRFQLSARVRIRMKDGRELVAEQIIPPGFAGDLDRLQVARNKYFREVAPVLGQETAESLRAKIKSPASFPVRDLFKRLRK